MRIYIICVHILYVIHTQDLAGDGVERIPVPANLWVWRSSSFCPTMYLKNISKQLFPHMCNTYVSYPCTMCTYMIFLSVCMYIRLNAYLHVHKTLLCACLSTTIYFSLWICKPTNVECVHKKLSVGWYLITSGMMDSPPPLIVRTRRRRQTAGRFWDELSSLLKCWTANMYHAWSWTRDTSEFE